MNIFFLSHDPVECAQYMGDKHVVKMTLETAQLLSTAHRLHGTEDRVYKTTHVNHPMTKWVCADESHYTWTLDHFHALLAEYTFRYGREHASGRLLPFLWNPPTDIPISGATKLPPLCMPDEFKTNDLVASYRAYYRHKQEQGIVSYGKARSAPDWL